MRVRFGLVGDCIDFRAARSMCSGLHVAVLKEQDVPLKGLSVEWVRGENHFYLCLTLPTGRQGFEEFAYAEYTESRIRGFETEIRNAVIDEEEVHATRAAGVRAIEAELAGARADTGPGQAARQHLDAVLARQKDGTKLNQAMEETRQSTRPLGGALRLRSSAAACRAGRPGTGADRTGDPLTGSSRGHGRNSPAGTALTLPVQGYGGFGCGRCGGRCPGALRARG